MPLSTSRAIAVTFTGLPANTSTTWQVGTSTTSPLYSGRCFINAEGSVTLYLDDILRDYRLVVYPRQGSPVDAQSLPPNVQLVNTPLINMSSTDIRQRIRSGRSIRRMVPKAVAEAIEHEGLYL
jgi:hypothetical protein